MHSRDVFRGETIFLHELDQIKVVLSQLPSFEVAGAVFLLVLHMDRALVCFVLPSEEGTAQVAHLHISQSCVHPGISGVASIAPLAKFVEVGTQAELSLVHQAALHLDQRLVFVLTSPYMPLCGIAFDHVEGLLCVDVANAFQQRRQPVTEVLLVVLQLSPAVERPAQRGSGLHELAAPEEASHLQSLLSLHLPLLESLASSVRSKRLLEGLSAQADIARLGGVLLPGTEPVCNRALSGTSALDCSVMLFDLRSVHIMRLYHLIALLLRLRHKLGHVEVLMLAPLG